jgi:hypothetical protein
MGAINTSKTLIAAFRIISRHIPEDRSLKCVHITRTKGFGTENVVLQIPSLIPYSDCDRMPEFELESRSRVRARVTLRLAV